MRSLAVIERPLFEHCAAGAGVVVGVIAVLIVVQPRPDPAPAPEVWIVTAGLTPDSLSNPIARADAISTRTGATTLADSAGPPRYYIGIAVSKGRSARVDPGLLRGARSFLASQLGHVDGVIIAPERETAREAQNVLREHALSGLYLDATISSIERQANGGLRVSVSILVATYPDREMRAIMRGAATATNGAAQGAQRKALEGALTSALRQLDRALPR